MRFYGNGVVYEIQGCDHRYDNKGLRRNERNVNYWDRSDITHIL